MSRQIIVFCDRCGHTLLPNEKCANATLPISEDFEPSQVSCSTFDLCSQCTKELISWTTAHRPPTISVVTPAAA